MPYGWATGGCPYDLRSHNRRISHNRSSLVVLFPSSLLPIPQSSPSYGLFHHAFSSYDGYDLRVMYTRDYVDVLFLGSHGGLPLHLVIAL